MNVEIIGITAFVLLGALLGAWAASAYWARRYRVAQAELAAWRQEAAAQTAIIDDGQRMLLVSNRTVAALRREIAAAGHQKGARL